MNEVYYGVLVSLFANISITVGHHVKRVDTEKDLSLTKLDHSKTRNRRSMKESCGNLCNGKKLQYILGQCLFFGGTIASAYSLAYAPQTLLASIGSIQFVANLVCSKIFHGNEVTLSNIIGTFGVIIGCLLIVFGFSAHGQQTKQPTINELFQNYNTWEYTYYVITTLIIASLTLICGMFCGSSAETNHLTRKKLGHLTSNGPSLFHLKKAQYYFTICSGAVYALCSAMPGTLSVVLGKTLAIIARSFFSGKLHLLHPIDTFNIIFILMVFISFSATQIYWMVRYNRSMKRFDPVFILPMNQVMWITFSTIAGGLYFHEFSNANATQWISLIGGLTINYLGLFRLVPSTHPKKKLTYADVSNMDLKSGIKKRSKNHKKAKKLSSHYESSKNQNINNTNGNTNMKPKRQNVSNLDHRMKNNRIYHNIKNMEGTINITPNSSSNNINININTTTTTATTAHSNITTADTTTPETAKTPKTNTTATITTLPQTVVDVTASETMAKRETRDNSIDSCSTSTTVTMTTSVASTITQNETLTLKFENPIKYTSTMSHWMQSVYNIVKDAMLSPSVQSPIFIDMIDSQSEPLLNSSHRQHIPDEIEDHGMGNSHSINVSVNGSVDVPMLAELKPVYEQREGEVEERTHFEINMDDMNDGNDLDDLNDDLEGEFDNRFENHLDRHANNNHRNNRNDINCDNNNNNNKNYHYNYHYDQNYNHVNIDLNSDNDSESSSSSSVCLHDTPVMTSSDTN